MRKFAVLWMLALLSAAACDASREGTPGSFTGPALTLTVLKQAPCDGQVPNATACYLVSIRNDGNASGPGSCQLRSTRNVNGQEEDILGPPIPVASVAPGSSVKVVAAWTAQPLKNGRYTYLCDPPIRM